MLFVVTLSRAPGADLGEISEKLLAPPGHDWEEYIWLTIYKLEEKEEIPVVGPVRAKEIINYPLPRHMWEMMEKERRKTLWKVSAAIGSGPVVEFSPEISKKLSPGAYKIEATLDTLSLPRSPQYLRILLKTHAYFTVLKPSTPKEKSWVHYVRAFHFSSKGELLKAVREALKARSLYPYAPVHVILAQFYESQGRIREAIVELEALLRMLPPYPPAEGFPDLSGEIGPGPILRHLQRLRARLYQWSN